MFQYPFPPSVGAITVTNEDFFCLYDGEFLNDIVISFYLKHLTEQVGTWSVCATALLS